MAVRPPTPIAGIQASVTAVVATPIPTPTPAPTITPTKKAPTSSLAQPASYSASQWDTLLQQYFGDNWQYAHKIMMCESGGNPNAIGPTDTQGYNPIGLFQIKNMPGRPTTQQLKEPVTNISYAASMVASQGWKPWECR